MNDEFYQKFPSFNNNSNENRRHKKISIDYKNFIKAIRDSAIDKRVINAKKTHIPVLNQHHIDVFSVEERNKIAQNESRKKQINYQKILLEQIENEKQKRKIQKEKEIEDERILESRLQKQIDSMNLHKDDPWQSRKVERISFSENEKHNPTRANNDVYRFFSKSSANLFNYKNRYFHDLDILKANSDKTISTECFQCHKKLEVLCSDCKQYKDMNERPEESYFWTNHSHKTLKYKENYAPYTFDNSTRFQENSLYDLIDFNYPKLYKEFKKRKGIKEENSDKNLNIYIDSKNNVFDVEDLLGNGHQQCTIITGYAKSLLRKS